MSMFRIMLVMTLVASCNTELLADNPERTRITVLADRQYGPAGTPAGRCDVYLPSDTPPPAGYPAVIVVPGGAWVSGDKSQVEKYARALANNGCVAIAINYLLAPQHKFPAQVDNVRTAMLWTKQNSEQFSVDIDRLGLFGYSAGGHLVTLVASLADEPIEVRTAASLWPRRDARWNQLPKVCAVCAGAPPTDFRQVEQDSPVLTYFLGETRRKNPSKYVAASPAAHVSSADPVTLIFHGDLDVVVPCSGSASFHSAQQAVGIDSRLDVMKSQGHVATFFNDQSIEKTVGFFSQAFAKSLAAATSKYR
jgi:triacylglycerol lipase